MNLWMLQRDFSKAEAKRALTINLTLISSARTKSIVLTDTKERICSLNHRASLRDLSYSRPYAKCWGCKDEWGSWCHNRDCRKLTQMTHSGFLGQYASQDLGSSPPPLSRGCTQTSKGPVPPFHKPRSLVLGQLALQVIPVKTGTSPRLDGTKKSDYALTD